jgi:hypothetical protein
MTQEEIVKLANELSDKEADNIINGFNEKEERLFNCFLEYDNSNKIAIFKVIAEKYKK